MILPVLSIKKIKAPIGDENIDCSSSVNSSDSIKKIKAPIGDENPLRSTHMKHH